MKQILYAGVIAISITACKSRQTVPGAAQQQMGFQAVSMNSSAAAVAGNVDPVCGMVKDSTWSDYTVYKNDTVWFCSSSEKDAFVANPQKYENKIKNN